MQPSPTEQPSIHPILQFDSESVHLSPVKHGLQKQIPFVVQDEFVDPCTLQLQAKNYIKFCYLQMLLGCVIGGDLLSDNNSEKRVSRVAVNVLNSRPRLLLYTQYISSL